mmetsp:Transcript_3649/g.5834  ORF Transcript_3649/g.5834 Transcript_3649/m.5834 type:complete len:413 (-) Transcript_3649:16-1254(-)
MSTPSILALSPMPMLVRVSVSMIRLRAGLILIFKLFQHVRDILKRKRSNAQELIKVGLRVRRFNDVRNGVDRTDAVNNRGLLLRVNEIDLVEQDLVRKRHLIDRLIDNTFIAHIIKMLLDVLGINNAQNGIYLEFGANFGLRVEREGYWRWVRHSSSLNENSIILFLACSQFLKSLHEIAANSAADTAVIHGNDILFRCQLGVRGYEARVYVNCAELVFDNGDLLAMILSQDIVDQRRLARAQEAGDNGDRGLLAVGQPVLILFLLLIRIIRWVGRTTERNAHLSNLRVCEGLLASHVRNGGISTSSKQQLDGHKTSILVSSFVLLSSTVQRRGAAEGVFSIHLGASLDEYFNTLVRAPETRHVQRRLAHTIGHGGIEPTVDEFLDFLRLVALSLGEDYVRVRHCSVRLCVV